MGSKILGLQFMRSILQLKGIRSSSCMMIQCPFGGGTTTTRTRTRTRTRTSMMIKVIRSDGVVNIYEQPIQVSELMLEFPKHMVCSSDSFYIGQKIPALSEHDHLLPGQSYFLLPNHLFQSVLSFVTITSFLASSSSSQSHHHHLKKALLTCQPFHIHKTPSGYLRLNVSEEFISQLMIMEELDNTHGRVCTTRQLQKDYAQLAAPRHWKPKLETIKETREKRRKSACACAREIKTSRKRSQSSLHNNTHNTQKSIPHLLQYSPSQASLSPKQSKIKVETTPKSRALIHHHRHNKIKAFLATSRRGRKRII